MSDYSKNEKKHSSCSKPSTCCGKEIKNFTGKVVPHKDVEWLCHCTPRVVCLPHIYGGFLAAINANRHYVRNVVCSKQQMTKRDYYHFKIRDFNDKIVSASTANQLSNKCNRCGNACNTGRVQGHTTTPIRKFGGCSECDGVAQKVIEEFNNICVNPNNPLNAVLSDLDQETVDIQDPIMLEYYTYAAERYLKLHPAYVQCVAEVCRDRQEVDTIDCPQCEGLEGVELLECIAKCVPKGYEGCPECMQYVFLHGGEPVVDKDGNIVFIDKDAFDKCMENCHNHEIRGNVCPGCEEWVDDQGRAIEPQYSICAELKCTDNPVQNVCPECEEYLEPRDGVLRMRKPIFVTYTVASEGGIVELTRHLYDVCFAQYCEERQQHGECAEIENPNELIKVDWKCPGCPEKFQYATRAEDCNYRKNVQEPIQQVYCPECVNFADLGYESYAECYLYKCAKMIKEDSIFFKVEECIPTLKAHGFWEDDLFIDCFADRFDKAKHCPECEGTRSVFGDNSVEYRNCIKANYPDLINNSKTAFLSKEYLKNAIKENVTHEHERVLEVMRGNIPRVEILKAEDCCLPYNVEHIDKVLITNQPNMEVYDQKSLTPQMGVPYDINMQKLHVIYGMDLRPIYINKLEDTPEGMVKKDKFISTDGEYTIERIRYIDVSRDIVMDFIGRDKLALMTPVARELLIKKVEKTLTRMIVKVVGEDTEHVEIYDSEYNLICDIKRDFRDITRNDIPEFTPTPPETGEYPEEGGNPQFWKTVTDIESCIQDEFVEEVLDKDPEVRKRVKEMGLTRAQAMDWLKYEILSKIDAICQLQFFKDEYVEYDISILEYLTSKDSLVFMEPDISPLHTDHKWEPKEISVDDVIRTGFTPKDTPEIKIDMGGYVVQVDTGKVIIDKVKVPLSIINKHLENISEQYKFNSADYINTLMVHIKLPQKVLKDVGIDTTFLKKAVIRHVEKLIDTATFKDSNLFKLLSMEVSIDTFEYGADVKEYYKGGSIEGVEIDTSDYKDIANRDEQRAVIEVVFAIDEKRIKDLQDKIDKIEDLEVKVKLQAVLDSIKPMVGMKLLEVPIDTFIFKDEEKDEIIIKVE